MIKLYSGTTDPFSHRCRFVLFEKDADFKIIDVDVLGKREDIALINPYHEVPVLVERDLVLYEANIINEYIDERFPLPLLMSHDPAIRARTRLYLHRFDMELYSHINAIEHGQTRVADKARQMIKDNLTQISEVFPKQKFMLGDEFSMLDVAIAPLLWRLDHYGIKLGNEALPLMKYAERLFARPAYIASMTPAEKAMCK
jgi:RNA polymerase-associated protein